MPANAGRGTAGAAVATSMACRPAAVAMHHVAWCAVRLGGARILPGRRTSGALLDEAHRAIVDDVRRSVGRVDEVAVLVRRQATRRALLALLLSDDRPIAFVKAVTGADVTGLRREQEALTAMAGTDSRPVVVPELLAVGTTGEWCWTAMTPLSARPHRPAWRCDAGAIATWLQSRLQGAVADPDVAAHWRPMHGDFAPWNLRKLLGGPLALFDFEDARMAPPAADITYWHLTVAALRATPLREDADREACAFWHTVVRDRLDAGTDPTMDQTLLQLLETTAR